MTSSQAQPGLNRSVWQTLVLLWRKWRAIPSRRAWEQAFECTFLKHFPNWETFLDSLSAKEQVEVLASKNRVRFNFLNQRPTIWGALDARPMLWMNIEAWAYIVLSQLVLNNDSPGFWLLKAYRDWEHELRPGTHGAPA